MEYRSFSAEYMSLLVEYRVPSRECRALLVEYWALLIEYRAVAINSDLLHANTNAGFVRKSGSFDRMRALLMDIGLFW